MKMMMLPFKIFCKTCRYFEDVKKRLLSSENSFSNVEALYGVCNNIQNEEYRCSCWEYYCCKNGREKKKRKE